VHGVDARAVDALVERSLDLLRRTYRPGVGDDGGWYHRLDAPDPGPSATATGMSSFLVHDRPFDHEQECLRFLRKRQIRSDDPLLDGGWAINTSAGQPVTEATALVARLLVRTGTALMTAAPDVRRAKNWLANNQNVDGGWGSFRGQDSRVWLTAMAVRALVELAGGTRWLVAARDPASHGWGEQPRNPATVTHTSYVLTALVDSGLTATDHAVADALADGFAWLVRHLNPATVWPFLEALADVKTFLPLRSGQVLTPLSAQAAVVQGGADLEVAPQRLLRVVRWRVRRQWLMRRWAAVAIGLLLAGGALFVATGLFEAEEVGFGLVVPIILLAIQVAMTGSRSAEH